MITFNGRKLRGWTVAKMVIALGSSVACADDSHWVPGAACEAIDGNYASQVVGGFGAVGNKSTGGKLLVSCPIAPNHFGYSTMDVNVSVTKTSAVSMTCAEVGRDFSNSSGVLTSQSVSGTGSKSFNFSGLDTQTWLFHSLRCDIPKAGSTTPSSRTTVNGYNYVEYN
jgi:hypothetical protein